MNITRKTVHRLFLAISIGCALLALLGIGSAGVNGLAQAAAGIFFALYFIFNALKNLDTDEDKRALQIPAKAERLHDNFAGQRAHA